MPVTALTFLAEPVVTPSLNGARADRSAESMRRLRDPFQPEPQRDSDDSAPGTTR